MRARCVLSSRQSSPRRRRGWRAAAAAAAAAEGEGGGGCGRWCWCWCWCWYWAGEGWRRWRCWHWQYGGRAAEADCNCYGRVVSVLLVGTACWDRGALGALGVLGQAGRPGFSLTHQGRSAAGGLFKTTPAHPCSDAAQASLAELLIHSCVPEQRQPKAAGSTCWCFWEPPAH